MRTRVGCDLVRVADVRESVATFSDRYLRRVYTQHEQDSCTGAARMHGLAARFAAKEAAMKVLRPADIPLPWTCIEVRRHSGGWCEIALVGPAQEWAAGQQLVDFQMSLSHEGEYAMAVVQASVEEGL